MVNDVQLKMRFFFKYLEKSLQILRRWSLLILLENDICSYFCFTNFLYLVPLKR